MTDLAAFVLARIEEDQAVARAAIGRTEINDSGEMMNLDMWHQQDWIEIGDAQLRHVQRHDPARVLAQCAALRAIVEDRLLYDFMTGKHVSVAGQRVLRALASIWDGHDDYDPAWRLG